MEKQENIQRRKVIKDTDKILIQTNVPQAPFQYITVDQIAPAPTPTPTPSTERIEYLAVPISDEINNLTVGVAKSTFRWPYTGVVQKVKTSVTVAPTGTTVIIDINKNGTSVLSTKLSIDATEKTSVTAAIAAVLSDTAFVEDDEITIDIDQVGSTLAGKGCKVYFETLIS